MATGVGSVGAAAPLSAALSFARVRVLVSLASFTFLPCAWALAVFRSTQALRAGEVLLGFGPVSGAMSLSESGDLHEAAARLFGALHALDGQASVIAVAPIPEVGLGRAINDRLRRAAAPR